MGKTKIGVIFNLDVSSGPGTHWVALYIDLKDCSIYYIFSYGISPIRRIQKFINFLRKKCVVDLKKNFILNIIKNDTNMVIQNVVFIVCLF